MCVNVCVCVCLGVMNVRMNEMGVWMPAYVWSGVEWSGKKCVGVLDVGVGV